MSFDLYGVGGRHAKFTDGEWIKLLELGRAHGWVPAGTRAPANWRGGFAWGGGYECNSGQAVRIADAARLARALLRGLPDVAVAEKMREYDLEGIGDDESLHPRLKLLLTDVREALRVSGLGHTPAEGFAGGGSDAKGPLGVPPGASPAGPAVAVGPDLSLSAVEFLSGEQTSP